ncbi:MAG: prepilin-type N-terminal cleavage/methylation domain-containing protein [Rhodocyclaceae bacterium]|nr:MAG: prepilin-type N-terminal cleavage/methylation domain-containing protein [Rhodocyclaceae bacterium]
MTLRDGEYGFNLIELMVAIAIAGVLLGLGLSSARTMLVSNKTRSAAESMQAGLMMARAEAIRRNAPMRFQLVSNLAAGCTLSSSGQLWIVSQTDQVARGDVSGVCNSQPYTPPDQPDPCSPDPGVCPTTGTPPANCRPTGNPAACASDPWIAYKSPPIGSTDYSTTGTGAGGAGAASTVTFGPIGQVLPNLGSTTTLGMITVTPVSVTDAKTWAVRITPSSGAIKLCDPSKASTDPLGC